MNNRIQVNNLESRIAGLEEIDDSLNVAAAVIGHEQNLRFIEQLDDRLKSLEAKLAEPPTGSKKSRSGK